MALLDTLNENEINQVLCQVGESKPAILLLEILKDVYEKETKSVVKEGKICDEDFRRDFRYKLGMSATSEKVLRKVEEARKVMHVTQ